MGGLTDKLAQVADSAATERILVYGSLPPEGRDLDLLARAQAYRELERAFDAHPDLIRRGERWALFADCTASSVELTPAESWGLAPDELESVFAVATPLAGRRWLVEPAPAHALLILARKVGLHGRSFGAKERTRIERALSAAPDAWERAEALAGAWGANATFASLREAYAGRPPRRRVARRIAHAADRARRGRVVALSGLDGAGKSLQANALQETLERLGYDAVTRWTPFASNRSLRLLAAPVKRVLGRGSGPGSLVARPGQERPGGALPTHAWVTVVAVANGLAQIRAALPQLLRGRVVIFDRYALDSAVHLRYLYGEARTFRVENLLIRALSPQPLASWFLDVPPEVVVERKPLQYDLGHVRRQARLYREEYERRGVRRLDGERPPEEVCAEIAAELWRLLP